jgi:hypothetical protein
MLVVVHSFTSKQHVQQHMHVLSFIFVPWELPTESVSDCEHDDGMLNMHIHLTINRPENL